MFPVPALLSARSLPPQNLIQITSISSIKLAIPILMHWNFQNYLENLVDTIILDESQKDYREQIQNLGFQVIIGNLAIQSKAIF